MRTRGSLCFGGGGLGSSFRGGSLDGFGLGYRFGLCCGYGLGAGLGLCAALHVSVAVLLDLGDTLLFFVGAHGDELDHLLDDRLWEQELRVLLNSESRQPF